MDPVINLLAALSSLALLSAAAPAELTLFSPKKVPWVQPAQGPAVAVLEGDPAKPGPFTLRLRLKRGDAVPVHWHDGPERLTVLSGTLMLVVGDTLDGKAAKACPAGTFFIVPPRTAHGGWAKTAAVVQIHGVGPFERRPLPVAAE